MTTSRASKLVVLSKFVFNLNVVCHDRIINNKKVTNESRIQNFKIVSYNVSGLSNKSLFRDFYNFLNEFDFIFLYETFLTEDVFNEYEVKFKNFEYVDTSSKNL